MNKEEKVQIFKDLVAMNTVNGHELQVAQYLKKMFDKAGIKNKLVPLPDEADRANLVAELGSGKPVLVVSGHMDTVAVNYDNWETDPFTLTKKGDSLYGRGATDMKGGLAATAIALVELQESGAKIPGTVRFLATAGEEVGQPGAEYLQKQGYMDDADALLITEPSGLVKEVFANKGELDITISAIGKTAHSSMPFLGINAVENLLDVLNDIKQRVAEITAGVTNKTLGDTVFNIDVLNGGNQVNAIPGSAQAELNVRTIPELANDKFLQEVQAVIDKFNQTHQGEIKMSIEMDIIPVIGKADGHLFDVIEQAAGPVLAKRAQEDPAALEEEAAVVGKKDYQPGDFIRLGISGGTDASKFLINQPYDFDYVVYGPGNNTPHQDNEYASETMYIDFIDIYKKIFTTFGA